MKQFFTALLGVASTMGVMAQKSLPQETEPTRLNLGVQHVLDEGSKELRPTVPQQGGARNTIFEEDFSNGFAGANGIGEWTVEDNGGDNSIWVYVNGNQGEYANGSSTDSSHPGGQYTSGNPPLGSTTEGNGWMIFDADFYNTVSQNDPYVTTEGYLVSPYIDLSLYESVTVNWESFFIYCCGAASPLVLEVGVPEGGETMWTTFEGHGNFTPSANSFSDNPLPVSVDVSCAAANTDSVRIRFGYRDPSGGNIPYGTYFWGIDDVSITTVEPNTDLRITQVANGDVLNDFEYRLTPMEQVISETDGGLYAGVMVQNVGTNTVENVGVLVEILNDNGDLLQSVSDTIDIVYALSDAPLCPATQVRDTVYFQTGWAPAETGTYTLRATLITDSLDATPENNVLSKEFLYTDDIYGHDDEELIDFQTWGPEEQDANGQPIGVYEPTGFGNFFHCPNPGSQAYGLAVRFGSRCSWNVNDQPDELEFETRIYEVDLNAGLGIEDSPYETAVWLFEDFGSLANGEIYLPFDSPVDLLADGYFHFAAVINEYTSPGRLAVLIQSDSDSDYSTRSYRGGWFSETYSPAIRVITSEREALVMMDELLAEQGVVLEQNMPNPANGTTAIRFRLAQHHDVTLEVRDIMGRTVAQKDMGTLSAGLHTWEVNVGDWASGMYTYTLKADRWSTTKKMSVK